MYIADGFNMLQEYDTLAEAIEASKNAPWANGGVYESPQGYLMNPEWILQPTRFLEEI